MPIEIGFKIKTSINNQVLFLQPIAGLVPNTRHLPITGKLSRSKTKLLDEI